MGHDIRPRFGAPLLRYEGEKSEVHSAIWLPGYVKGAGGSKQDIPECYNCDSIAIIAQKAQSK